MPSAPRTVQNNLLRSEELPSVQIQVDPQFDYIGMTSFIIYGNAHAETHLFVVANSQKHVQRLLWFQFEGFLDSNIYKYEYPGLETMTMGGLAFLHNADVLNIDDDYKERPTSDSAHVVEFLKEKGYTLEGDTMFERMFWLDSTRRNELMIIYSEDLDPTGHTIADLGKDGTSAGEWPALSRSLHERALASFTIQ